MEKLCFDYDWRFDLGDPPFSRWSHADASNWRRVDLPHDWSIEFERAAANPSGASGGFFPMGLGWYHKEFASLEVWHGKKVWIEFEGVYMNAEVWLNGHFIGRHPYGYTSFYYDLTPYLHFDSTPNQLRVFVDNAGQLNSRWYSGSGIYRHVWLMVGDPLHVAHWGIAVTTPEVSAERAVVQVRTLVENETGAANRTGVRSRIIAPTGEVVGVGDTLETLAPGERREFVQTVTVARPQLWSPTTPYLYRLETEVRVGDHIVDTLTTPFGIRSLLFDAKKGFQLNGQTLKLKGGCVHHDTGLLGAEAHDRAEERKVEVLKASGFNAVRCAHNPPSPAFLDACDRLGMLVVDEAFDCWRDGKNHYDYHVAFDDWWRRDLESMIQRDRNHPSVIMWSIGNEVQERARPEGVQVARQLADHVRALDPTRPVTAAINEPHNKSGISWSATEDVFATLEVCGYNYQRHQYAPDLELFPQRVVFGSESFPKEAFEYWMDVMEHEHVIGDFVWTSLDYLGESGIGRVHFEGSQGPFLGDYPWHHANCGDIDICGFKRPQSYYRDVLWGVGSPLYIAVHPPVPEGKTPWVTAWGWPDVWPNWNWPGREGQVFKVEVYSACEKVELFLNGKSLGTKPATFDEKFIAAFDVPYAPGSLRAVGYRGDQKAAECEIKTVGAPTQIRLTPDRNTLPAKRGDLSYVTVEIVDKDGCVHPGADQMITFALEGEGEIAAVGSSNPTSTERYRGNQRQTFRGRCLVVVKVNGKSGTLRLSAQADGLAGAETVIMVG